MSIARSNEWQGRTMFEREAWAEDMRTKVEAWRMHPPEGDEIVGQGMCQSQPRRLNQMSITPAMPAMAHITMK